MSKGAEKQPLQLIGVRDNGTLSVGEEAVHQLQGIDGPVLPVFIVGQSRTGKVGGGPLSTCTAFPGPIRCLFVCFF